MSLFMKEQQRPRELGAIRIRTLSGWYSTLRLSIAYEKHSRFKGIFRGLNRYIPPKVTPFLRIVDDHPPYSVKGKVKPSVDIVRLTKVADWQLMLKAYLRQKQYTWIKSN